MTGDGLRRRSRASLDDLRRAAEVLSARPDLRHVAEALRAVADDGADLATVLGLRAGRPGALTAWTAQRLADRRRLLREAWRSSFPTVPRTRAARLLEAAWGAWQAGEVEDPHLAGIFDNLNKIGARPLKERQINEDLDEDLHKIP